MGVNVDVPIYSTLEKLRDDARASGKYEIYKDILDQLLIIAFNNEDKPGHLPDQFKLCDIHFSISPNLKNVLNGEFGFNFNVHKIIRYCSKGTANFEITRIKEE